MTNASVEHVETRPSAPEEDLGPELVIRTFGGYVTLETAAALFGVRRETLQTAAWRGSLPARKLTEGGGQGLWMVRPGEVVRYLVGQTGRPGPRPGPRRHRSAP